MTKDELVTALQKVNHRAAAYQIGYIAGHPINQRKCVGREDRSAWDASFPIGVGGATPGLR